VDWLEAPLDQLIGHIVDVHHAYLKAQLPRLDAMLEKILSKHSAHHGAVLGPLAGVFRGLKEELESHLFKEEMVLFPLVRAMEAAWVAGRQPPPSHCGSVGNPIRVMLSEHDGAGEALARMRQITSGYTAPEDACNTFRAFYYELDELESDLHRHIHLENNFLFPRAIRLEQHI
jgi:regulator of cell morphogenesis and NO signaling